MTQEETSQLNGGPSSTNNATEKREPSEKRELSIKDKKSILRKFSNKITQGLEQIFYRYGVFIGSHPKKTIVVCFVIPMICSIGLVKYKEDRNFSRLLIPPTSRIPPQLEWIKNNVPMETRGVTFILENHNVLTKKALLGMMSLYKSSLEIRVDDLVYTDFCTGINGQCIVNSLLDLWRYNETVINSLTDQDIVDTVDQTTINPTYFVGFDVDKFLGGISRDDDGHITGAKAARMTWLISSNNTIKEEVREFEIKMVELGKTGHPDLEQVYMFYKDSYTDEFFTAIYGDMILLAFGFPFLLIYINCAFGKPNLIEHRFLLVIAALAGVLLAAVVCYGVCLGVGLSFGAPHACLLFLLFAIGVDDAFVIMESWKRVNKQHLTESLEVKLGLTMKHAGVSVTVTSITDMAAFAVGISSVMPVLSSFCAYSTIGILALYIMQSTLFPACLVIDQKRVEAQRNGLVCCVMHKNWQPNSYSDLELYEPFFRKYFGPILLSKPGKVITILISIGMCSLMTWSVSTITKGYVFDKGLTEDSFATKFLRATKQYFPKSGYAVEVYCGKMDYASNIVRLDVMMTQYYQNDSVVNGSVVSWIQPFHMWLQAVKATGYPITLNTDGFPDNSTEFNELLYKFAYQDPSGLMFKDFIHIVDGEIQFTKFGMQMYFLEDLTGAADNIRNVEVLRGIADNSGTNGTCWAIGEKVFIFIETQTYVGIEILRNFILASVSVFFVCVLLIVDIRTSFFVLLCVMFTTICLGGMYQFLGYRIDATLVAFLTFSIGMSVDYSAHIGHTFMTVTGSKTERAQKTLNQIGPAVWHGAFSTFLGFSILAFAQSFSGYLFFITFSLVVTFGTFFGLCFLPVVLSLLGPDPYDDAELDTTGVLPDWPRHVENTYRVEETVEMKETFLKNGSAVS